MDQEELNQINQQISQLPERMQGDSMSAKLERAKAFDTLATESELIRLEALCRIADALEEIDKGIEMIYTSPHLAN